MVGLLTVDCMHYLGVLPFMLTRTITDMVLKTDSGFFSHATENYSEILHFDYASDHEPNLITTHYYPLLKQSLRGPHHSSDKSNNNPDNFGCVLRWVSD